MVGRRGSELRGGRQVEECAAGKAAASHPVGFCFCSGGRKQRRLAELLKAAGQRPSLLQHLMDIETNDEPEYQRINLV